MTATKTESTKALVPQFKAARRASSPLVAIQTPDEIATVNRLSAELNGSVPLVTWDCVRGFTYLNKPGKEAVAIFVTDPDASADPVAAFKMAAEAPENTVIFCFNAHRWINESQVAQAAANLRDQFKSNFRTLVFLAPQIVAPAELAGDVVTLDEPLPDASELRDIVEAIHDAAGLKASDEVVAKAVDAIQGLSAFAAEQVTAMSINKDGLDCDALWERKRKQIEQTPGLSVSREGTKFADLGGLPVAKQFMADVLNGPDKPNCIVFIDEIEKCMAGSGDTSGVNQDQLATILSYMQDNEAMGVIFCGHPGSGKSALAKAVGNEGGIPTIKLDLGAAKGSLVGQSEQQLRTALKVVTSVSNNKSLWVATCNSLADLKPELLRRFQLGIFFFDLPNAEERATIWNVHRKRFGVQSKDKTPNDEGWTGAEIETCCRKSRILNRPLEHAAKYVVPISQSAADKIESLRNQADGKWLNASAEGTYQKDDKTVVKATGKRKLNFD